MTERDKLDRLEGQLRRMAKTWDAPWKITLLSIVASVVFTVVIMLLFGYREQLPIGIVIAFVCSAVISYVVSTQSLNYYQLVERKNEQLLAINAELDAYTSTVAHDLKIPVSKLLGFCDLLQTQSHKLTEEQRQEFIGVIASSSEAMAGIIDSLLLLAQVRKREDVPLAQLDMKLMIADVKEQMWHQIIEMEAEIITPKSWPSAVGYEPWVREVWTNYLSNGLKYGGQQPRLELGGEENGKWVRFWIRDHGPGIPEAEQAELFNEFSRLETHRDSLIAGNGLGLSIVQRIVHKLGGEVGVESKEGQGSLFYFTLPVEKSLNSPLPQI